jgi:hypothetical protein
MFLNSVAAAAERVDRAVDVSPRKAGMYVVGTGTPIVGPADLRDGETRRVILANPIYREEVARELGSLGLSGGATGVELVAL